MEQMYYLLEHSEHRSLLLKYLVLQYITVPLFPEWSDGCSDLSSPLLSSTSATVVSSGSLLYSL